MNPQVERLRDEILAHEPSPELLLQLTPAVTPGWLADYATHFARAFAREGRPRIAIEILRQLVLVAHPSQQDYITHQVEDLQHEMEWLHIEIPDVEPEPPSRPLSADDEAALLRLGEAERAELLGQVLDRWQDRVNLGSGPPDAVAANGGDHEPEGEGAEPPEESAEPPEEAPPDDDAPERPAFRRGDRTPARRPRYVSTGFAMPDRPRRSLPRSEPLQPQAHYLFWLDIGRPVRGSIEQAPTEVLAEEKLPTGARLRVVTYTYGGELELDPAASEGEFFLDEDGWFRVLRQPGSDPIAEPPADNRRRLPHRLFFPVATPAASGVHRLRCNIYFRNVLVQSRVVSAAVGETVAGRPQLQSALDYSLARLLSSRELAPIREHALSIMLNDNGDGTHQFRFLAEGDAAPPIVENANLGETQLADLIGKARRALRKASWGTEELYREQVDRYRYRRDANPSLENDLVDLMQRGLRIYDALINRLAGGADAADALRERMRAPGRVEIKSHKERPSELVPASLIYDYVAVEPFRSLRLCPQFVADRKAPGLALEDAACFTGDCPSRDARDLVCPSGFWGFRHRLGMPVMFRPQEPPPIESRFAERPTLGMAIHSGLDFVADHRAKIAAAVPGWDVALADTLETALDMIGSRPHVTYFYCHGGSNPDGPFLRVGSKTEPPLERFLLRHANRERMKAPRTLVVINGCRTAALEPKEALELVSAFVENVGAMGVIGTEVTIFEELATAFGARLLARLRDGMEVGEAVRRTRLSLLKDGNPLGLVYLPFVAADARLVGSA